MFGISLYQVEYVENLQHLCDRLSERTASLESEVARLRNELQHYHTFDVDVQQALDKLQLSVTKGA